MEIHKNIDLTSEETPKLSSSPYDYFVIAKKFVKNNYNEQYEKYENLKLSDLTPDRFYEELIWVIHATGFSAKAVGKFIPRLLDAYGSYQNLANEPFEVAFQRIKLVCNNEQKSKAVQNNAINIVQAVKSDWAAYRDTFLSNTRNLSSLPYIGKVTAYHLGRNIGLIECVKPDLHLVRMANHWGFETPESLVEMIKQEHKSRTGEYIASGLIDMCLWYAASTFKTTDIRKEGER